MEKNIEKKSVWGGARKNSGRKKVEGSRHTYTVADDVHEWIKEHGDGAYLNMLIREIMCK